MVSVLSFVMVILSTLFGAVGALFLKHGSKRLSFSISNQMKNWELVLGVFLFVVGMAFFVVALRVENLAIIYPITSLSYVWIAFLSKKYLNEEINKYKWIGILLIVVGVVLVSR